MLFLYALLSALMNRLLGRRRRAKTANTPGITKSLQWILVKDSSRQKEFELPTLLVLV
jgi:ribosome biogenesis GTPase A